MRRLAGTIALLFAVAAVGGGPRARAAEDGIFLGGAREVRVTGTIFDANTSAPLAAAQVAVEAPYGTRRADTGPDGTFFVTARADDGLGNVSVVFSHGDYQQKYLETVVRDVFRGNVDVVVAAGRARVKAKKVDLDLACGGSAEVGTKAGDATAFRVVCDGALTGVEFEVRRTRIAVLAAEPFTLRVASGRLEVRDTRASTIELRVAAAMLPR
jgi:hypothetical protein